MPFYIFGSYMIVIFHDNKKVSRALSTAHEAISFSRKDTIAAVVLQLATAFPEEKIAWCHESLEAGLDTGFIQNNETYRNTLFSFNPSAGNYFTDAIGYVETNPFIAIDKTATYPTWLMSGAVGYAHASVFLQLKNSIVPVADFDYFLCSVAKTYMAVGLFCYSEPGLLHNTASLPPATRKASVYTLFKFVKQHYRTRWIFLLLLNLLMYEKRFPLLAFLLAFTYKRVVRSKYDLAAVPFLNHPGVTPEDTIDVLIPTVGRKGPLYDVLQDLKNQMLLPKNIIIVEQNADPDLGSELGYLTTESWPFTIKHTFTHQLGACNARNVALAQLESKWVFFADDDVRFNVDFLKDCLLNCKNYGQKAITLSCLQKGETMPDNNPIHWESFGTCSSFVAADVVKPIRFDLRFEFGYGEDIDFGKKIRNSGTDVLFFTQPSMLHLKAPIGGFRTKFKFAWDNEAIQPKPSPTVMLYKLLHCTKEELLGYKTTLLLKYYKHQKTKNPLAYWSIFNKQWNQSIFWANELKKKN